jgi:hypothetical protein
MADDWFDKYNKEGSEWNWERIFYVALIGSVILFCFLTLLKMLYDPY